MKERLNHKTEEAKSAITYRYRHAAEEDGINGLIETISRAANGPTSVDAPQAHDDEMSSSESKLKASMVNEITRVMSASLTSTAKGSTSGIERIARWRNAGIVLDGILNATPLPSDATSPANPPQPSALRNRQIYQPLAQRLPRFSFITGGISSFHPLKPGSWVLVGFKDRLWLGSGALSFIICCETFNISLHV